MPVPSHPITLTADQLRFVENALATLRHNVNNQLSLIVASAEIMRRRPEMASRLLESLVEPPEKIGTEVKHFSDELERILGITRS
jgi:hypothetical protein